MKKLKFLFLVNYFVPQMGYEEYYLSKTLTRLGHEVIIATSDKYYPYPNYNKSMLSNLGLRNRRYGKFLEREIVIYRLKSLFEVETQIFFIKLKNLIKFVQPDIIFQHNFYSFSIVPILSLKSKYNYKIAVDLHMLPQSKQSKSILKKIYLKLFNLFLSNKIREDVDLFYGTTPENSDYIKQNFMLTEKSVKTRLLGSNIFSPKMTRIEYKNKYFEEVKFQLNKLGEHIDLEKYFIIGSTGKFYNKKRIDRLLKITHLLRDEIKILCILTGYGEEIYFNKLKKLILILNIHNKVFFLPAIKHELMQELLYCYDMIFWIGDIPSISSQDALGVGTPIVISNKKQGAHEAKKSGGFIFDEQDEKFNLVSLSKWIKFQAKNKQEYEKLRVHAKNYAIENLDYTKLAEDLINDYLGLHY